MTVHVPARHRQKIIDDDARSGLEFERSAQRAAYRLTSIYGSQLLVRQIEDAHRLGIGKRLVEPDDERFPEMTADQKVAEKSSFDCFRAAPRAEVDEVVGRLDLAAGDAEDSTDRGAEIQSVG